MLASFRATIQRIESSASSLNQAAAAMAETSDSSGRSIGEVAQSISAISEGAAHQVSLITNASPSSSEIEARSRRDGAQRRSSTAARARRPSG